ncbi:MAG: hypothetical protein ACOYJS_01420 [Acutalibacteraceae bacterium]|jgi:hypothetical protein
MAGNIILFPDYQKLKEEVEKLRIELSMLILERDQLRLVECKNIEMLYMLKLGSLEYKAYEAQCAFLRLKRKMELIQAKKNRQEKIIMSQIEETLEAEFEEFQKKLEELINQMNAAIERSRCDTLSAEENKELKSLYFKIVKALHPDLNPNITESQLELFYNAVSAYENGDLNTLRIINELVSDPILPDNRKDAMTQLNDEKVQLYELLNTVKKSIEAIKSEFPYTAKELVNDPEKIEARKAELNGIIRQYEEAIAAYNARIEKMLR